MKKISKKPTVATKKVAVTKGKEKVREIEIPISDNKEIQDGVPPKSKLTNAPKGYASISLNIGCTLNMGDFQSARIDVFIQRNVVDTEETIKDGMNDISDILHDELARQSDLLGE